MQFFTGPADLVGVGLNATDTVLAIDAFPAPGSKSEFHAVHTFAGGQTATAVVACQKWGLNARYVGSVGDDAAGEVHRRAFELAGVEAHLFVAHGASSKQSYILVDGTGERTIVWKRDARTELQARDLKREWVTEARVLHVDGSDVDAATTAAGWARESGIPVVADLDDLYPGVERLLPSIDHLIVSRDIPERLTGKRELPCALQAMQREYGCALAAATLGEDGVLAWDGERFHAAAAFDVPVVDTTGAGDLFHAGYILGLRRNWPLKRTLDFACAAAALNCTSLGARGNIASVEAINALIASGTRHPSPFLHLAALEAGVAVLSDAGQV